jgi:hypothetical protein
MTTPISKQFRWSDEDINKAIQETKQKVLEIIDERIRLNKILSCPKGQSI